MRRGYSIVATLSFFIRFLFIQNYWPIIIPMTLTLGSTSTKIDVSLIVAEGILWAMSFHMTRLIYKSGSFPTLGAILYLLFYAWNTFILSRMSSTGWAWYSFLLAGILYFAFIYVILKVKNKYYGFE